MSRHVTVDLSLQNREKNCSFIELKREMQNATNNSEIPLACFFSIFFKRAQLDDYYMISSDLLYFDFYFEHLNKPHLGKESYYSSSLCHPSFRITISKELRCFCEVERF